MNTHESYVSLETAKLLKQAGFDWETEFGQHIWDSGKRLETNRNFNAEKYLVSLPTLTVAQRWLREKNLLLYICPLHINKKWLWRYWFVNCIEKEDTIQTYSSEEYKTYEEALEAGIKKCLETILENK